MQKGLRAAVAVTLALVIVGLALLQPVSGQPGQWKAVNPVFFSAPTSGLNDVWMISSTQGWAVGDSSGGGLPGIAIYWDGTQWRQILTPTLAAVYNLESVACLSVNNCIAVGTGTGPVLLQWDGTSWIDRSALVLALGPITALHAIHIRSDGLGFAVGEGSPNIVRVNVAVSPPTVASEAIVGAPDRLRSVWILPPGTAGSIQGFAVGDNGVAGAGWRWDGTPGGWLSSPPGAVGTLRGIQVLTPNEAIAIGGDAVLSDSRTRWNGASWTPEGGVVIATAKWRAVYAIASNDGWMVGEKVGGVASIAHWNGVAWTAFTPPNVPVGVNLNSIYMLSSSDGWAVGEGGAIIRWNGSSWNSVAGPAVNDLLGVWLASSADGWAVGTASSPTLGQILRWNGANWNFHQTSPVAAQLNAIHGSGSTNVFAVGDCPGTPACGGAPPAIVRWTGGPAWVNISPAGVAGDVNLYGVFSVSPSLAFAVGGRLLAASAATMLKWDGTVWASIPSGTPNGVVLRSVWMISDTDGWAVGGIPVPPGPSTETIVRYTGAVWAAETSPTTVNLNAVQALTSTNVWAVGDSGTIIHRDAVGWSIVPSGVTQNLYSLYMISATEGWAVGAVDSGSPIILYWDGSTWSRVYPTPAVALALRDIWMVNSQDGWSVGHNGLILRFTGGPVTTASTSTVTATSTTTQSVTSTSWVATSTVSTQITSTETVPTTATSTTWIVTTGTFGLPPSSPVPGFPFESILAGLFAGAAALLMLRRRRRM